MANVNLNDPFRTAEDDQFAQLDLRGEGTMLDNLSAIAEEHPEFAPTPEEEELPAPAPAVEAPVAVTPSPETEQPEVLELQDGSSITVEKTNRGYKATLDTGVTGAGKEVFYGASKDEMWQNIAAGKIQATKKIRQMTQREKLQVVEPAQPEAPAQPQVHQLSAEEIFQIKTELQADPDKAMQKWFQLKTGMSVEQLVALARSGQEASVELDAEAISKMFLAEHPEYISTDENYVTLMQWLSKNKLGVSLTDRNKDTVVQRLHAKGFWTVATLNEAFEDLAADGLLALKDEGEEEVETPAAPVPAAPAPAAAAPAPVAAPAAPPAVSRIANTRVRPRLGQGISERAASAVTPAPADNRPISAEEFENLSDEEVAATLAAVRRHKAQTSARR